MIPDSSSPPSSTIRPLALYGELNQVKRMFYWFIGLILVGQLAGVLIVLSNHDTQIAVIILASIPFVLATLFLIYINYIDWAAVFLAFVLMIMVTITATQGLGIHHIGVLGYPAILVVASLLVNKRTMVFLFIFTVGCVAWLVFGELSGAYTPIVLNRSVPGDFFSVSFIILLTAVFVRMISESLFRSNLRLNQELKERKLAEEKLEHDIALRLQAEEQIRQLNASLEQRVHQRTTQLEEAVMEMEAFSYSVSHDLRAPLRAIDGYSHLLLDEHASQLDGEGKQYLDNVIQSVQYMSLLIDGLLNLGRVIRAELVHSTLSLSDMAQQIINTLRLNEPDRQVQVQIQPEIVARGDPDLIRTVLDNLLGNAWKFTSKQPQADIGFSAIQREGKTIYRISDNGVGFNLNYAKKLFLPFQRLHRRDEFEGTGIGLATVQRIIQRHGGEIWVEAEEGKGAVFYFTLAD
jgi:signal transduction histidine kinase